MCLVARAEAPGKMNTVCVFSIESKMQSIIRYTIIFYTQRKKLNNANYDMPSYKMHLSFKDVDVLKNVHHKLIK